MHLHCGERRRAAIRHGHWKDHDLYCCAQALGDESADVQPVFVSTLTPGNIVVMDNVSAHKTQGVREAIKAAGCQLVYLLPIGLISIPSTTPLPSSKRCYEPSKGQHASTWRHMRRSHEPFQVPKMCQ